MRAQAQPETDDAGVVDAISRSEFWGSGRMAMVPSRLGFSDREKTDNQANHYPHAFRVFFVRKSTSTASMVICRSYGGMLEISRGWLTLFLLRRGYACSTSGILASWYFCVDRFQTSREARKVVGRPSAELIWALLENRPEWSTDTGWYSPPTQRNPREARFHAIQLTSRLV